MFAAVSWSLADDSAPHVRCVKDFWNQRLLPFTDGYYTHEVADEGQRVIDENCQGNLARPQVVKKRYDPTNLFRPNANVKPAV